MGDKELPIQVTTIALNNQEDNEGYPQQEQEIGVDKLQIMQFVPTSTGQDTIFAKIQRYSFFTLTYLASTWEVMYFGEASIKSNFEIPKIHHGDTVTWRNGDILLKK